MHFAVFSTTAPQGHLQRALDELDRAGFELAAVLMSRQSESGDGAAGRIRIDFHANGTITPETYLHRLARMAGVLSVEGGPCGEGAP